MYGTFLLPENGVFQTSLITSTPQRIDDFNYLIPYLHDSSSSNSSSLISSESDTSSSELDYKEDREEQKTGPLHHDHKYISLYEEITNELSKSAHSEHCSENDEIRNQKSENSLKDHSFDFLLTFTQMTEQICSGDLQRKKEKDCDTVDTCDCTNDTIHHVNIENIPDGNCSVFAADDPKLEEMNTTEECAAHPILKPSKYKHQVSINSFRTSCYGQLLRDYFVHLNYFVSNVTNRFRQK